MIALQRCMKGHDGSWRWASVLNFILVNWSRKKLELDVKAWTLLHSFILDSVFIVNTLMFTWLPWGVDVVLVIVFPVWMWWVMSSSSDTWNDCLWSVWLQHQNLIMSSDIYCLSFSLSFVPPPFLFPHSSPFSVFAFPFFFFFPLAAGKAGDRLPPVLSGHRRHRLSAVRLQHGSHQRSGAGRSSSNS